MVGSVIAFLETLGFPPPFAETLFRLLLGAVCGGLIGLEREFERTTGGAQDLLFGLHGRSAGHGDQ